MASVRIKKPAGSASVSTRTLVAPEITPEFLAELVRPNCAIEVLRLHDRPYSLKELQSLCKALRKNLSVRVLDLTGIFIAEEFWRPDDSQQFLACKSIAGLLLHNQCLNNLILDGNPFSYPCASELAIALLKSPLKRLSLSFCEFETMTAITEILRSLNGSSTLVSLNLQASIFLPTKVTPPIVTFLNLYERMADQVVLDQKVKNYFDQLKNEKQLVEAKAVKTPRLQEEEFPVVYVGSPPTLARTLVRTMFPVIDPNKKVIPVPDEKGLLSPLWSPGKFSPSGVRNEAKRNFADENARKKQEEREFFSLNAGRK